MASRFNHRAMDENVQVYRNDFFTGFMLLIKKLFML